MYRRGPLVVACNLGPRRVELEIGGRMLASSDLLVRHLSGRLKLPPSSAAWLDVSVARLPPAG